MKMKKKFWVCAADSEDVIPSLRGVKRHVLMELLEKFTNMKDARKYIRNVDGPHSPPQSYVVLEVWEEVE